MKRPIVIASVLLAVIAVAVQRGMPDALAKHTTNLKQATAMKATISVSEVGGKAVIVEIAYAKPNLLRIDTPTELIVSDGETMTILDKAKNSYTEQPVTKADLIAKTSIPSVWGWASFMQTDPAKLFKDSKSGPDRKRRGIDVSQVTLVLPERDSTATMYVDKKTGVARGYNLKVEEKQWVVWAETIETSSTAPASSTFEFVTPEGAELVELSAVGEVSYSDVSAILRRNCLPCHGARSEGGLSIRTYRSLMSSGKIVEGDASRSRIINALRGTAGVQRMPQGRAPLSDENIEKIEAWINAGANEE